MRWINALEIRHSLRTAVLASFMALVILATGLLIFVAVQQVLSINMVNRMHDEQMATRINRYALTGELVNSDGTVQAGFVRFMNELAGDYANSTVIVTDTKGRTLYSNFEDAEPALATANPRAVINRLNDTVALAQIVTHDWHSIILLARRLVIATALMALMCLGLYRHMKRRFGKLERSIAAISNTLEQFEAANYTATVTVAGPLEIVSIQKQINNLARALNTARLESEEQVLAATRELNQTLEEVEIKNVELDLARKRAVESNEAKSTFLANISHEIRSPMNGIIGHLQLLQRLPLTEQQSSYVNNTLMAAYALLDIIDDTLNLSRIEANRLDIQNQPFDLLEEVSRCVVMLAPNAIIKKLDFYLFSDPAQPRIFYGDSLRIRQIMTNLISNAIKYTETGSIRVRVASTPKPGNKSAIELTVADSGLGMDSAQIESLFEAYSQAGRSPASGTGLGLLITRSLTEAMDGTLELTSEAGRGSMFTARLTLAYEPDSVESPTATGVSGTAFVHCQDSEARHNYERILSTTGLTISDFAPADADVGIIVLTHAQIEEKIRKNIDIVELCGQIPTPHVVLAGTDNLALIQRLQQQALCEAMPLHSHARSIQEAVTRLLNHRGQQPSVVNPRDQLTGHEAATDDSDLGKHNTLSGFRVLLADDDNFGRAYMSDLLEQHGMRVDSCDNGIAAVEMARHHTYDLILLDIRMPECDGVEATRRIREFPANQRVPIIGMTASVVPEQHQQCVNAGMTDYWIKPLQIAQLISGLGHWLHSEADGTPHKNSTSVFAPPDPAQEIMSDEMRTLLIHELDVFRQRFERTWQRDDDIASLREAAHALNGNAAMCGLSNLQQAAHRVEVCAREGDIDSLPDALVALTDAVATTRGKLAKARA